MRLDVTPELTFLDAERVDGSVAGVDDSVVGAGGHDGVVDWEAGVFGNVQLPAELAHKRQAHGPDLEERGWGYSGPEERDRMENRLLGRMVPSELGSLTLNLIWKYGAENGENSPRSILFPRNCVCVSVSPGDLQPSPPCAWRTGTLRCSGLRPEPPGGRLGCTQSRGAWSTGFGLEPPAPDPQMDEKIAALRKKK